MPNPNVSVDRRHSEALLTWTITVSLATWPARILSMHPLLSCAAAMFAGCQEMAGFEPPDLESLYACFACWKIGYTRPWGIEPVLDSFPMLLFHGYDMTARTRLVKVKHCSGTAVFLLWITDV